MHEFTKGICNVSETMRINDVTIWTKYSICKSHHKPTITATAVCMFKYHIMKHKLAYSRSLSKMAVKNKVMNKGWDEKMRRDKILQKLFW